MTAIIVLFAPSVTITRYLQSKLHDLDHDLLNGPRLNVNISIDNPYTTFYMMAVATFAVSVTIYEIFAVEKRMTISLTFRMCQGQMRICQSKGRA